MRALLEELAATHPDRLQAVFFYPSRPKKAPLGGRHFFFQAVSKGKVGHQRAISTKC